MTELLSFLAFSSYTANTDESQLSVLRWYTRDNTNVGNNLE